MLMALGRSCLLARINTQHSFSSSSDMNMASSSLQSSTLSLSLLSCSMTPTSKMCWRFFIENLREKNTGPLSITCEYRVRTRRIMRDIRFLEFWTDHGTEVLREHKHKFTVLAAHARRVFFRMNAPVTGNEIQRFRYYSILHPCYTISDNFSLHYWALRWSL